VQFPSASALEAVEASSAEPPPIIAVDVPSEGWALESDAIAAGSEPWTPRGPMEEAIGTAFATAGKKAQPTRAMSCVARELGRFELAHGGPPPEALARFIAGVCGAYAPNVGYQWLRGEVPSQVGEARIVPDWRSGIQSTLIDHLPADARQVGFWFGRKAGRAVAVAVHEEVPVTLGVLSPIPDANGNILVVGRLEGEAAAFDAYVNEGRFGVERCAADPTVISPDFRVTCHLAPEDQTAWLQVVYVPPNSVLALPLVQVLARRDPSVLPRYVEAPYAASRPVAEATAFAPAVVAELNRARGEAGLTAVRLSEAESAVAARLARPYFASALSPTGALFPTANTTTIVLGLVAGWQVTGTIREGTFFSAVVPNTRDAGRWVDLALSMPLGRHTLLARDIDEVALGASVFGSPQSLGAVACGYRFHHDDDHAADAAAVFGHIAAERARLGLSPPQRLGGAAPTMARELAQVRLGKMVPYDALQATLQTSAHASGSRTLKGYLVEATSIDLVKFPTQFLSLPNMHLEVGVTHYKPPGAAWAQLVILVIYDAAATYAI
jgi:hypothetical protein